ncbi:MAG TPA: SGNH/GDSL hydrolase family protein [Acidimicrobiales bacterium]|nr:SGNH/GDSL hydrolase family protein [Acidimicrobiales bacterium]
MPRFLGVFVVVSLVASASALGFDASRAGADSTSALDTSGFYLDLGASASVGYQPTLSDPHGEATAEGYANDLVSYEANRGVTLALTELGCPGESTSTMISGEDSCYRGAGSQLSDAVSFLQDHQAEQGLVTIDLGFNDFHPCLIDAPLTQSCVGENIEDLNTQLPYIVGVLRAAAGPHVSFVGLGHYDPYVADAIHGLAGEDFANRSKGVVGRLNATLSSIYSAAEIQFAEVSNYFDAPSRARVHMVGVGDVSSDVLQVCDLTWMCAKRPYGPNLHPNVLGYSAIAAAIESQLIAPW